MFPSRFLSFIILSVLSLLLCMSEHHMKLSVSAQFTSANCSQPTSVFYDATHDVVYASCFDNVGSAIIEIGRSSVTNIIPYSLCGWPMSVVYDAGHNVVYAACAEHPLIWASGGRIIAINRTTLSVISNTSCPYATSVFYDATHALVYAACLYSANIISIQGTSVRTILSLCSFPTNVLYSAAHDAIYVGCEYSGVVAISRTTLSVTTVASSSVCPAPTSVYYDSVHDVVYAACSGGDGVIAINGTSLSITQIASPSVCQVATRVFYEATHNAVYAGCGNGAMAFNAAGSGSAVPLPSCAINTAGYSGLGGFTYDVLHDVVYGACKGAVVALKPATVTSIASATACPYPTGTFFDPVNDVVYADCTGTSVKISGLTVTPFTQFCSRGSVIYDSVHNVTYAACGPIGVQSDQATFVCPDSAYLVGGIAYDATRNIVYTACAFQGCKLFALNGTTLTVIASIPLSSSPQSILYEGLHDVIYVSAYDSILFIQASTLTVMSIVSMPVTCYGMSYDPVHDVLYAACMSAGIFAISRTTPNATNIASPSFCDLAYSVSYDDAHDIIYAACDTGVLAIRGLTVMNVTSSTACLRPQSVSYDAVHDVVYAACNGGTVISIVPFGCPNGFGLVSGSSSGACAVCAPGSSLSRSQPFSSCLSCSVGSVSSTPAQRTCDVCAVGYYATPNNPYICIPCAVGNYSNTTGATACRQCSAGMYAASVGASVCTVCAAGTYASTVGTVTCQVCSGGTYSPAAADSCLSCSAGYYCAPASTSPTQNQCGFSNFYCPPQSSAPISVPLGFYSIGGPSNGTMRTNISSCLPGYTCVGGILAPCPLGSFSLHPDNANTPTCLPCSVGMYSNSTGSSTCTACAPGYSAPTTGTVTCQACPRGSYSSSNASTCLQCSLGMYSDSAGASTCTQCAPGYYAPSNGTTTCRACPGGTYSSLNASTTCYSCQAGYYCPQASSSPIQRLCGFSSFYCPTQSSAPISVPLGWYSTGGPSDGSMRSNISSCLPGYTCVGGSLVPCSPGSFSTHPDNALTPSCQPCGLGMYSDSVGASSCIACAPGHYAATEGASVCAPCQYGSYTLTYASQLCSSCPAGVDCRNGTIAVEAGVYVYNTSISALSVAPCLTSACVGGDFSHQCGPNRQQDASNFLCASCLDGYSDDSGTCVECDGVNGGWMFGWLLLNLLYVIFIHVTSQAMELDPVPVIMYFVQIVLLIIGDVNSLLGWLSVFGLSSSGSSGSSFSFPCFFPATGVTVFAVNYCVQLLFFVTLILLLVILRSAQKCVPQNDEAVSQRQVDSGLRSRVINLVASAPSSIDQFIRTGTALVLYTYTNIATITFQYFQCTNLDGAAASSINYYVPTLHCDSASYKSFAVVVYLFLLIIVIGFPIALLLFQLVHKADIDAFYKARSDIKNTHKLGALSSKSPSSSASSSSPSPSPPTSPSPDSSEASSDKVTATFTAWFRSHVARLQEFLTSFARSPVVYLSDLPASSSSRFVVRFGLLFQHFRKDSFYWSAVVVTRRTLSSAMAVALYNNISGRSLGIFVVQFVALMVHVWQQPYRHHVNNLFETWSLMVLVLVSAIVASYQTLPYPNSVQAWICFLVLLTLLFGAVIASLTTVYNKRRLDFATQTKRINQSDVSGHESQPQPQSQLESDERVSTVEIHSIITDLDRGTMNADKATIHKKSLVINDDVHVEMVGQLQVAGADSGGTSGSGESSSSDNDDHTRSHADHATAPLHSTSEL